MSKCPKCGASRTDEPACKICGVIYVKAEAAQAASAEKAAAEAAKQTARANRKLKAKKSNTNPCAICEIAIAKTAKTCPHCGAPQKQAAGKLAYILAGLFLAAFFFQVNEDSQKQPSPEAQYRAEAARRCKSALVKTLRDPDSLVIENLEVEYDQSVPTKPPIIRQAYSIRAKNGFGGYVKSNYICEVTIQNGASTIINFAPY